VRISARELPVRVRSANAETGSVRVRQNQRTAYPGGADLAGIVGSLMGLSAAGGSFYDHKRHCGSQGFIDRRVAHAGRSDNSGSPTAILTALQNGRSCGFSAGQRPKVKSFSASSRPPSADLNQMDP
jgi:hypothetical protein